MVQWSYMGHSAHSNNVHWRYPNQKMYLNEWLGVGRSASGSGIVCHIGRTCKCGPGSCREGERIACVARAAGAWRMNCHISHTWSREQARVLLCARSTSHGRWTGICSSSSGKRAVDSGSSGSIGWRAGPDCHRTHHNVDRHPRLRNRQQQIHV